MEMQVVKSSNVQSIGYADGVMHIEFRGGRVYSYTGPKAEAHYKGLMQAESIGKYFAANVRDCRETICRQIVPLVAA